MAVGQFQQAHTALTNALSRYPHSSSIRLRLVGRDVKLFNGLPDEAKELLDEINRLAGSRTWAYRDPANVTALGRAALLLGADPKMVLDRLFEPVKKSAPDLRDIYLATGQLALDKGDFPLAAMYAGARTLRLADGPDEVHLRAVARHELARREGAPA